MLFSVRGYRRSVKATGQNQPDKGQWLSITDNVQTELNMPGEL